MTSLGNIDLDAEAGSAAVRGVKEGGAVEGIEEETFLKILTVVD